MERSGYRDASPLKIHLSRQLRKQMTPSETRVWNQLRRNALGFTFHRQRVLFGYIADFYCAEARLCIEIDGEVHYAQKKEDRFRDEALGRRGVLTLRFTNDMVTNLLPDVLKRIKAFAVQRVHDRPWNS